MSQSTEAKNQAFGKVLSGLLEKENLDTFFKEDSYGVYNDISGFIKKQINSKKSPKPETVRAWVAGRARPWKHPKVVLALYRYFKEYRRIEERSLLVQLLILCEYPDREKQIYQDFPIMVKHNRITDISYFQRFDLLEKFHMILLSSRNIRFFLLGCPHICGSSTFLLQILQLYQGIYNQALETPFRYIVYIDCNYNPPNLITLQQEIYETITHESYDQEIITIRTIYNLLKNEPLLLALDNVPEIPPTSNVHGFLSNLGKPHVVLFASNHHMWSHPMPFTVEGILTVAEAKSFAHFVNPFPTFPSALENDTILQRLLDITAGIPSLLQRVFTACFYGTIPHKQSNLPDFGSGTITQIETIYRTAWQRLRDNPHWFAIEDLLYALPLNFEAVNLETLQRTTGLSTGNLSTARDALIREFLFIRRDDGTFNIAFPFRWFVQRQLSQVSG